MGGGQKNKNNITRELTTYLHNRTHAQPKQENGRAIERNQKKETRFRHKLDHLVPSCVRG
jgi:hypothetical protein